MEEPDRVAAAANAGDKQVGETLLALEDLAARLDADDAVEIAHHHRIRVRPEGTAEDVVGRANVRDPVAQGLVDRFLEGLLPGLDPAHFGPEETHADDVEALALHVCRAHVNDTLHPEARRHCRRRESSAWKSGSSFALKYSAVSVSSAAPRVSGTKRPPKVPKWPLASGRVWERVAVLIGRRLR